MTDGESTVVKFRAKVEDRNRWWRAAEASGKDFSTWAREVLDAASPEVAALRPAPVSPADLAVVPWKIQTGDMIDLLTPAQLAGLPKGTRVVRIDGVTAIVGVDEIDGDTRQGRLAYGIPQKPKDGTV